MESLDGKVSILKRHLNDMLVVQYFVSAGTTYVFEEVMEAMRAGINVDSLDCPKTSLCVEYPPLLVCHASPRENCHWWYRVIDQVVAVLAHVEEGHVDPPLDLVEVSNSNNRHRRKQAGDCSSPSCFKR